MNGIGLGATVGLSKPRRRARRGLTGNERLPIMAPDAGCDHARGAPRRGPSRARRRDGGRGAMGGVTLKNLSKTFKNVVAVDNMNLEIRDKEFLVLVGPSGCGKTTALRMVAGLEEATAGEIFIGERLVNDVSPKDRDIAMVFQNYALLPHISI